MKFLSAIALLLVSNASFLVGATEEQHDVASSTPDEEPQRELTYEGEDPEMWGEDVDYEDELMMDEDVEAGVEDHQDHRELGGNYGYRGSYGRSRNYNRRPAPAPRYYNPAPAPRYYSRPVRRPVRSSTVYYRGKGKSGMGGGKSGMGGGRSYYRSRVVTRPTRVVSHRTRYVTRPTRVVSRPVRYYGGGKGKGKSGMGGGRRYYY